MVFIVSSILLVAISIIFLYSKFLKKTFDAISKKSLKYYFEQNPIDFDKTMFSHYYLSNSGIFVASIYLPFGTLFISSIYSLCILLLIGIISFNVVFFSVPIIVISAIFLILFFKSNLAIWFPTKSAKANFERTAVNYRLTYPDDEIWQSSGIEAIDKMSDRCNSDLLKRYFYMSIDATQTYYNR